MGVQQTPMWQQPSPQSSAPTNPFAAPSGPSVRDCCSLNKRFLALLMSNVCLEFFVAHTYFFSLSLSRFLSSCLSNTDTVNPFIFFLLSLSLARRCRRTSQNDLFTFAYIFLQFL